MKRNSRTRLSVAALAVGLAMLASACQVNGGATLMPITDLTGTPFEGVPPFDVMGGSAILAVTSTVDVANDVTTFRSAGTFRNREEGVAFTFRIRNSQINGSPLSIASAVPSIASKFGMRANELQCAAFGGEIGRIDRTTGEYSGVIFGAVITDADQTAVLLFAVGGPVGPAPVLYIGEVAKGKLNLRSATNTCTDG